MQSEERLKRLEKATDLPLLILAIALIPLLILPLFDDLPDSYRAAFLAADWFIWAVFAVDFAVKLAVAPSRWRYVRTHWLEVAMVALPFLRPLRIARLLRFARVAVVLGINVDLVRDLANQRGTKIIVLALIGTLLAGSTGVLFAERGEPGANIEDFGDSIWWGITTMTTVGYGDRYPTTAAGRGIATALMFFGIAAMSAITATVAAFLVRDQEQHDIADVMAELHALRAELRDLRGSLPTGDTAS
ncbi:MAG: potassium channel family protein [Tepidiformaceae bacterium]